MGYIAKNDIKKPGKHGQTNTALETCICMWSLLVMKPNAAERHRVYMQTQIVMCLCGLPVKGFVARVVEMNN